MAAAHRAEIRRVLMLAYYFPPLGGAGVQRTVKFAKYLPEYGWRASIVTTSSRGYPANDPGLAGELPPGTRVVRAPQLPGTSLPTMALSRLGLARAARIAAFPDDAVGWAPMALRHALQVVAQERPDVLFSTSAPFTSHLVALAIQRRTGIPWVADFRDEWAANPHQRDDPAIAHRAARRLERAITARASAVTVVADYFEIAGADPRRTQLIPNGVDEADLVPVADAVPTADALVLTFVGTLYGDQDAAPVFASIDRLVAAGAIDPARLRVQIVGNDWLPAGRLRASVSVERAGYVSHEDAIGEMAAAGALVHYVAPASRAPGGKVYEYLASGRPILCVARPDGGAAALVRESGAGPVAAPDDPVAIDEALLGLYRRWREGTLASQPQVRHWTLRRFSRRRLAGELAGVLEGAGAS